MEYNKDYLKIQTDNDLMETIQHGTQEYPFRFYYDNLKLFDFNCIEWHWHTEFEFVYVEKGSVTFWVGQDKFELSAGMALFINSKILHRFYAATEGIIPNFVCMPTFIAPENSFIYSKYIKPILNASWDYYIFGHDILWQADVIKIFLEIIELHKHSKNIELKVSYLMQNIWQILWENIFSQGLTEVFSKQDNYKARLQVMMNYIHTNYSQKITLEDICAAADISKSTGTHLFQNQLFLTPVKYLISYRLQVAAHILHTTEKKIATIASECGFESVDYFCKTFKKQYTCTPSEYRKRKAAK